MACPHARISPRKSGSRLTPRWAECSLLLVPIEKRVPSEENVAPEITRVSKQCPSQVGPMVRIRFAPPASQLRTSVRWSSAFPSLLELAEACDVPVRWSCRTGVCHSRETGLIGGTVSYRPDPVEPPADDNLL